MRLEFDAPQRLFQLSIPEDQNVAMRIRRAIRARWFAECMEKWQCSRQQTPYLAEVVVTVVESGNCDDLHALLESCLRLDETEPFFRIIEQAFDDSGGAEASSSDVRIAGPMAARASRIGARLWGQKKYKQAARVYRSLIALFPQSATSWLNLAINYRDLGNFEEASQAARQAISIDPLNEFVQQHSRTFTESNTGRESDGMTNSPPAKLAPVESQSGATLQTAR
jgi:tetratricopeptide (TPR) repeat protein